MHFLNYFGDSLQGYACRVTDIKNYVDKGVTVYKTIKLEKPEGFSYRAGQFAMLAHPELKQHNSDELLWRAFSIASSPLQDFLEFTLLIKYTGGLTQYIEQNLDVGSTLMVRGPFGSFCLDKSLSRIVFVATGCGITPLISMLRTLLIEGTDKRLQFFYGFRNANQFLYREELEEYARKYDNFDFYAAASDDPDWPGFKGYVNPLLTEHAFKGADTHFYVCGSPVAMESIINHLKNLGYLETNIHTERWVTKR